MKQGKMATLLLVPFVGSVITACDAQPTASNPPPAPEHVGVCVHPTTNVRLDDDACGEHDEDGDVVHSSGGMFIWFHGSSVTPIAPVGSPQALGGSSRNFPVGKTVATGVDKAGSPSVGSSVQRGGLGIKGATGSGGAKGGSAGS